MSTRALYTPSILQTLHTLAGIDSQNVKGGNTHVLKVTSRDVSRTFHIHIGSSTSKSVLTSASFKHFTLVLESIHTCQGREHSRAKRRVETSAVQSTPAHKAAHQSQYSVHHLLLQLLKTNRMISSSTVFESRFRYQFVCGDVSRHTDTNSHGWITNDCNLKNDST